MWLILVLALNDIECQYASGGILSIESRYSIMAKTKSSKTGKQDKKTVPVKPYKRSDGTTVKGHRRSTPN